MVRWTARQRLKNDAIVCVVVATLSVVGRLPVRIAAALGAVLGRFACLIARSEHREARLACVWALGLGRVEAERLATRSFASIGRAALELCAGTRHPDQILGLVELPETERARLDDALALGRGVVFVTAHLGSWELLAWYLASLGYPISTIAAPSYDPRLTRLLSVLRRQRGVRSIWRSSRGAARRMLRVLRRGEILGTLIDQSTRVPSVDVPFFGRPAPTPIGAAKLALRTGAEVVAGFLVRQPGGRYRVQLRRLPVLRRGTSDVVDTTRCMTLAIEKAVRDAPEQWVWMHRRWQKRAA